jgi:enhancing lycopene biosynthesis protein 2
VKKIAVVLSGCGYLDGTEITEAVSTLICLSELGADVKCFAPSVEFQAFNHFDKTDAGQTRNSLIESARIARSEVSNITELKEKDFDAVVFPGGFGAAKNLSDWATKGSAAYINKEVSRVIRQFHKAIKPIGAICIAPAVVAKVLGEENVTVTIGEDTVTAAEIEKTGARHSKCAVDDYISDRDHKVLTTPAYMYENAKPSEVFNGIRRMLIELVEMA